MIELYSALLILLGLHGLLFIGTLTLYHRMYRMRKAHLEELALRNRNKPKLIYLPGHK